MWTSVVDERCRLKDAHLVLVCSCNLARIGGAVDTADSDVVVYRARDDLYSLKRRGEDNDVASCCVNLKSNHLLVRTYPLVGWEKERPHQTKTC